MAGAKETPRQKMIGMMYLVLTALLALNISKEVLNGFVKVENSLRTTQETLSSKIHDTYTLLELKYNSNQEKVGPFYDESQVIVEKSNTLIKYITKLKAHCLATSEGDFEEQVALDFEKYLGTDEFGNDTVLNIKYIGKKDEFQALTTYMIGGKSHAPKVGEWTANGLKLSLEAYSEYLKSLDVTDINGVRRTISANFLKSLDERFSFEKEIEDGKEILWEAANFYDVPLAAVIPLMSKMIIDVQDAEEDALSWLLGAIESKSLKFSEVMPLTIPLSNYILRGDTVRASIFLAAFDRTKKPEVYIDPNKWDGKDSTDLDYVGLGIEPLAVNEQGQGLLAMSSKGMTLGQYQYKGVIRYQGAEGDMQSLQFFTPTFTIAEAALVVSPTKMNVFYRGVPNPVEISVPGVANNKLRVSISNGHSIKKQQDGTYIVDPATSTANKEAVISVMGEMADGSINNLGSSNFRVKRIPDPVPFWAGKMPSDRTITKNEVLSFAPLAGKMDNFDFDVKVLVKSFTIRLSKDGTFKELNSPNNRITSDMKALLNRVKRGDTIYFEDIIVGMPDGTERMVASLKLKITS
ncbi:MAG: gliding motility protein GldM [Bacteroidetes bacterium]|nr:gliding motility protein GldM [Bacteroidota bacterium]MDA0980103.1 gliding motility protein GldM [Bacteroidota bacterium]